MALSNERRLLFVGLAAFVLVCLGGSLGAARYGVLRRPRSKSHLDDQYVGQSSHDVISDSSSSDTNEKDDSASSDRRHDDSDIAQDVPTIVPGNLAATFDDWARRRYFRNSSALLDAIERRQLCVKSPCKFVTAEVMENGLGNSFNTLLNALVVAFVTDRYFALDGDDGMLFAFDFSGIVRTHVLRQALRDVGADFRGTHHFTQTASEEIKCVELKACTDSLWEAFCGDIGNEKADCVHFRWLETLVLPGMVFNTHLSYPHNQTARLLFAEGFNSHGFLARRLFGVFAAGIFQEVRMQSMEAWKVTKFNYAIHNRHPYYGERSRWADPGFVNCAGVMRAALRPQERDDGCSVYVASDRAYFDFNEFLANVKKVFNGCRVFSLDDVVVDESVLRELKKFRPGGQHRPDWGGDDRWKAFLDLAFLVESNGVLGSWPSTYSDFAIYLADAPSYLVFEPQKEGMLPACRPVDDLPFGAAHAPLTRDAMRSVHDSMCSVPAGQVPGS